ncbi:hypothetical protein AN958_11954 [Leucoagaricus sp. SymC.cos]|nr:hypothetical protein AN958_11954 [Leucoagaricus sp. SymC.cos]
MQGQKTNWRGGPRPPIGGRARTKDDLEVRRPQETRTGHSFPMAMLGEQFNTGGLNTQPGTPDRASRRWALDIETELQWRQMLQNTQPIYLTPTSASASSSPVDSPSSRWQFFGPRPPRRATRASPSTPYTPHTPFTPYTPDTPELETPEDEIPGSYATSQKSEPSDLDSDPLHGREFLITPFLLREPSVNPSPSRHHTAAKTEASGIAVETQWQSEAVSTWLSSNSSQVDDGRDIRVDMWDSTSIATTPITPSRRQSEPETGSKRSSRPRLSIVTSSSWSRSSTSSRELKIPKEPLPTPPSLPRETPTALARLTELLAADVLLDQQKYRNLLAYRGDDAQLILDCLQVVLDYPFLRNADRAAILKALMRLSTRSCLYPRCFKLQGVVTVGSEAIDEGRYGDVWKAVSHDQVVCLKVLRTYQRMPTEPLLKKLSHEALLWGQLSHPNILPFYGIHINEVRRNRFGLVSPWMENGNIVNYLKLNPHVPRILLIHDIASGLQYLHSLNFVHGDIKGTNILVTSKGRACLADFGVSTLLGDNILNWPSLGSEPGRSGGTTRWRAPELFLQESTDNETPPTPTSDVYSFGCAAYEVLTGRIPFHEIKGEGAMLIARLFTASHEKPSRPSPEETSEELTDEMWNLMEDCWNFEPNERPSLDEVLRRLERLMKPEQVQALRDAGASKGVASSSKRDVVLSSSLFRRSFNGNDKPSDGDLLKAMTMVRLPVLGLANNDKLTFRLDFDMNLFLIFFVTLYSV